MHLRSLSLRNYRVYRAVDLEFPDGLIGIYGPNGSGKCLPGHVRVYDADAGGMVPIRQFVLEQRKHTLGLRNGRIERVPVTDWMVLGERPTVEIALRNGARVEVAETHPILTDRGCVQAKDLTREHWVAEAAVIPPLGPPPLRWTRRCCLGCSWATGACRPPESPSRPGMRRSATSSARLVERLFPGATIGSTAKAKTSARNLYVRSQLDAAARRSLVRQIIQRLHELGDPSRALRPQRKPPWRSARRPRAGLGDPLRHRGGLRYRPVRRTVRAVPGPGPSILDHRSRAARRDRWDQAHST